MGLATLKNAVGTHISAATPTTNYDAAPRLGSRTGGTGDAWSLLYFPRGFPLGATIISATLKLYSQAFTTGTHTLNLQRTNQAWSASKVTWNTRPTALIAGVKTITKSGVLADKVEWSIDVTDWMQSIANGGVNYGFKFQITEAIVRYFYGENSPEVDFRPRLELSWSDAPSTPTGLAPSGGRKVGVSRPVVRANYIDVSGSTTLQAVQVQVNSTDVWTAPTFDSGTVLTPVPELDLSTTAFVALADGATVFWRIRLQDAAGLWSPWSAAVSFQYDTKGTLTMTSPSSGTPTVEDATPPILWTFTGETQAYYQIQITHLANTTLVTDWDSGKVPSTVTSVTVPSGINEPSFTTYTVTLRVWDNKQREATPGDPVYSEVARQFTFVPGATNPVVSFTATPDTIRPKVDLAWQRAVAPDRFNVLRNSKVIAATLDPALYMTASGTFSASRTLDNFNASLGLWHISTGGGTLTRDTAGTPILEGTGQARVVRTWAASGVDFYRLDNGPLSTTNQSANGNTFQFPVRLAAGGPADVTVQMFLYGGSPLADQAGPVLPLVPGTIHTYQAQFETAYVTAMQHVTLEFRRASSTAVSTTIDFDNVQQGVQTASYAYTDNSPSPRRSLTYSVQAVANNVASGTNPTQTVTVNPPGVWLRHPDSGLEVCIVGRAERQFVIGEHSAVLESIASSMHKIGINQSMGGLEGSIEGTLVDFAGKTAQEWRDQYLKIRNLRVKRLYLTVSDYTFEVVAQEFTYAPRPVPEVSFDVSFRFYQQDDITRTLPLGS